MDSIQNSMVVVLAVVCISQSLFVFRYGVMTRGWRRDFVGRALFFKSTAVCGKAWTDLALWWAVDRRVELIPMWLLIAVVFWDVYLALGCTWQYLALERQKREDRHDGTSMGQPTSR